MTMTFMKDHCNFTLLIIIIEDFNAIYKSKSSYISTLSYIPIFPSIASWKILIHFLYWVTRNNNDYFLYNSYPTISLCVYNKSKCKLKSCVWNHKK